MKQDKEDQFFKHLISFAIYIGTLRKLWNEKKKDMIMYEGM
jgi:hypothetical protein